MLEISRVMMELKLKNGWVPKRSIMFMSWGSEEYGLIGSVEWVEVRLIQNRLNLLLSRYFEAYKSS